MNIGNILKNRLEKLGISIDQLSGDCLLKKEFIKGILEDQISLEKIDMFDLKLISNELYCTPAYFWDENKRKKDVVLSSFNRGNDTKKSNLAKARLQKYVSDYIFLKNVIDQDV